jgi:hypothetical protein
LVASGWENLAKADPTRSAKDHYVEKQEDESRFLVEGWFAHRLKNI